MPATVKKNYSNLKQESDQATDNQMNDIFAQISSLGLGAVTSTPEEEVTVQETVVDEEPIIKRNIQKSVPAAAKKAKKGNSGYVSLVIPDSIKTKWKVFCSEHGISLTDSIKLGMKLLMEMEDQNMISIEDGVITMNM